jgi:hypothetical protein
MEFLDKLNILTERVLKKCLGRQVGAVAGVGGRGRGHLPESPSSDLHV